jgi:LPS O-antigen subunit length determinant protein (WzzB/FepE family)
MKKNNPYITDDEIDIADLVRTLWREKILILSISIIFGLLGYLHASFKPEEFKTVIKLQNPPSRLFEPYTYTFANNNNNKNVLEQFIYDFKSNLLSLDNLEIFVEESRDLDTFKAYLKLKNISAKQYFANKFGEVKEKNIIIPNTYFFVFEKKILNGDIFLDNYLEFIKKKNIIEFKNYLKFIIENRINNTQDALETARLINLENPILQMQNQNQVIAEPEALFYKGTKVLLQSVTIDKKLMHKLENDEFNYKFILDKASLPVLQNSKVSTFFIYGVILGLILSLVIIFLKNLLKK